MKTIVTIGILAALISSANAAPILVNGGDFEPGHTASLSSQNGNGYQVAFGAATWTGFTIAAPQFGVVANSNTYPNPFYPVAGDTLVDPSSIQYAFFKNQKSAADPFAAQSLTSNSLATVAAGQNYTVGIDIVKDAGINLTLQLFANGTPVGTTVTLTAASLDFVTPFTVGATAAQLAAFTGDSLTFVLTGDAGNSFHQTSFDNVTLDITTSSVPEPSTYGLVGCGVVGLLAIRRFRNLSKV